MRLRSSQFVLLMLLICSPQVREDYAWHLRDGATTSRMTSAAQQRDSVASTARQLGLLHLELERLTCPTGLSSGAAALHRAVWTMPSPAAGVTAIVSHTSLLRA